MGGNGLMFGMEGPNMEGTWYNPKTGDSFTVRNSFFEDSQYIVQTTDGRLLNYNQLQSYIQSDVPIETPKSVKQEDQLPPEVASILEGESDNIDYLLPDDMNLLKPKSLGNLSNQTIPQSINVNDHTHPSLEMNDMNIIDKALKKKTLPNIQVNVDWNDFPRAEIGMLQDMMDISIDNIIKWYTNQIDVDYVVNELKNAIGEFIKQPEKSEKVVAEKPKVEEQKSPKTTSVKNSKKK